MRSLSHSQKHPYELNIFKQLSGPSRYMKKLGDYTPEEVAAFPRIVKLPIYGAE